MLHERPMSYLYEVGIQGGIRRAADMLGINPSVISRQIAQLERALELPLLERQGRNVVLTEAGRLLAEDYFESRQRREKLESSMLAGVMAARCACTSDVCSAGCGVKRLLSAAATAPRRAQNLVREGRGRLA